MAALEIIGYALALTLLHLVGLIWAWQAGVKHGYAWGSRTAHGRLRENDTAEGWDRAGDAAKRRN